MFGCQAGGTGVDHVVTWSAAIQGSDAHDVTASQTLPARAVGWIEGNSLVGDCTATPILRDVVLTAGHCVCAKGGRPAIGCDPGDPSPRNCSITFHLPHPDPVTGAIVDVGNNSLGVGKGIPGDSAFCHPGNRVSGTGFNDAEDAVTDIAIIRLRNAVTPTELGSLPQVYTLGDFLDRMHNHPSSNPPFFPDIAQAVGFDGSIPNAPVRHLAHTGPLNFDSRTLVGILDPLCSLNPICGNDAGGVWIYDSIDAIEVPNRLLMEHGDSGGPITFQQNGLTTTVFGVFSIAHNVSINDSPPVVGGVGVFNAWSPTWDNGTGNGSFISQFLVDADGDGVSDAIDNCSPPRCKTRGTCSNPDQNDDDGDGVGDTCDNCRGSVCTSHGFSTAFCKNPHQEDIGDKDGVGDICDLCTEKSSSALERDTNSDGVGDSCDTCPKASGGGRRACKTNADCAGKGFCITTDLLAGHCTDGTNRVCGSFFGVGCPCAEIGMWGACSQGSEPDTDGDGIGDRCDSCRLFADANLQQNSNAQAETREGAMALNDACDSTPVFTARPVVEPNTSSGAGTGRTLFTAFAGVGSDTSAIHPPFPSDAGSPGAPVGFRHCDCTPGSDEIACLNNNCGTSRGDFDRPPSATPWKVITVGASPAGSFSEAQVSTPALDLTINPIYTGGIDCTDPLPHQTTIFNQSMPQLTVAPPDRNLCRLGTATGRLLSWQTTTDIAAGRVQGFTAPIPPLSGEPQQPQSVLQTVGYFWSHGTVPSTFNSAGTRDQSFFGRLRDNYSFVHTPSLSTDVVNIPRVFVRATTPNCLQCYPIFSTDWVKPLIQPGVGLNVFRLLPRPFAVYSDCNGTGSLCAIRRSTEPHIDLAVALNPEAQAALLDSSRTLITPVEPFAPDDAHAGGAVALSVPRSWSQVESTVIGLGPHFSGRLDALATYQAFAEGLPENVTFFGGEGFVPSDREGARWLYSKLEEALYMVGGTREGKPTSEIWRLDLKAAEWKHLFMLADHSQVAVRNVAALAYDAAAGRIIVVDDAPGSSPQNARVVAFDTRTDSSRVLATLDLSSFSKTSVTATGGGTFILVGAQPTSWTAYRFQITSQNKISWLGKKSGQGFVVADPLPWQEGPGLFIQTGQDLDTVDLPPPAFTPAGAPPELKTCDQPLVVAPPPPLVITTCHSPTLVPPTPTSACGPVSVRVDAPADFVLGSRTINWTMTDTLGNTVTVPQTITAILGDDVSCCPAGINVIRGTSNNDQITGTAGPDCILALGGQDTINGGGGDDVISAGEGDDIVHGGLGNDRIYGGGGQDLLYGDDGNDTLSGGTGDDQCWGGAGNDVIFGGDGQDKLFGEDGGDTLYGENGDDRLSGGTGNDVLDGGPDHNACSGGSGTNQYLRCETFF
jgi:hypothetical protein